MVENSRELRNYFLAGSKLATAILMLVIGVILCITVVGIVFGIILIILGVVILINNRKATDQQVDLATKNALSALERRAETKLNIVSENLIDPIAVRGYGAAPDSSMGVTKDDMKRKGRVSRGLSSVVSLFKSNDSGDPIDARKIGKDDVIRSMLVQYTKLCFGEDQLYVYIGNSDISTGRIYEEVTVEIFYKDITNVSTVEQSKKLYNAKKKDFVYYTAESVLLLGSGINYSISLSTFLNHSHIDDEFTGMKNLIRDKKLA